MIWLASLSKIDIFYLNFLIQVLLRYLFVCLKDECGLFPHLSHPFFSSSFLAMSESVCVCYLWLAGKARPPPGIYILWTNKNKWKVVFERGLAFVRKSSLAIKKRKKNLFLPYLYLEILPRVTREQKNTRHVTHAKAVHAGIAFTPQTCFCKAFFSI